MQPSPWYQKKSKILITGAAGFLGSYITRKLISEGFSNLGCLKRNTSNTELTNDISTSFNWIDGDILDIPMLQDAMKDADVIIHAAAIVNFHDLSHKKMLKTAKEGTANLVNISLDNNVKKFIHISSVAAIGRRRETETISEKNIFSQSEFDTTYGLSKFLAEQEVWRGHAEGLNVTILNPSMILGAGKWDESSVKIFKNVYSGLYFYPPGSTGWVDVRDVAESVFQSLIKDLNGQRYIISAENIQYFDILKSISKKLSVSPPKKVLKSRISSFFWRWEVAKAFFTHHVPIITKETIKSMSAKSTYENNKSVSELGIKYTPIENTIAACCKEFLDSYPIGKKFGILY
ncbi:MAG: NAD-dependent epimerase/dehydratase family protein [Saprospiraceae bacterium]|nr:NAD-dependent epimerase/dehydratase family protein [Saprospiraceae bacterium]